LTPEGRTAAREGVHALAHGAKLEELKSRALNELAGTAAILAAKAPNEAGPFKDWLKQMAKLVAEAGAEGGFLGLGGVKVSDAERATLAEVDKTLA
jgi:hypothetical protein